MQTIQNYCVTTEGSYLDVLSLISSSSSSTGISSLFFCGADCLLSSCEHKMMFYINETPSTSLTQEFPTVLFHMHPYQTACFKTLFKQLLTIRLCLLHKHPYPTICAILSQNDLKINTSVLLKTFYFKSELKLFPMNTVQLQPHFRQFNEFGIENNTTVI